MKKGKPSINPTGRRGKQSSPSRYDDYKNLTTAIGVSGYDKRLNTTFTYDHVSREDAIELWTGDDIAARAINIPVEDAFRQGFQFVATAEEGANVDTKQLQEDVQSAWEDIGVLEAGQKALGYEMAFGGSAVLPGVEGLSPEELMKPKNLESFRELKFLNVFEACELPVKYHYVNPFKENYGKAALFQFSPLIAGLGVDGEVSTGYLTEIHESNLIVFPGIQVSKSYSSSASQGWGESVYTRLWRVLRDFNLAWAGVGNLVQDFSQTVMKFKNLAQLLAESGGAEKFKSRLQAMDTARSILRGLAIDTEEDIERKTTNVTGLAELLQHYMARISSAAGGIPITKLFGVAPSGLNSSGESDINQWDDRVKSIQDKKVIPYLHKVTEILIQTGKIPNAQKGIKSWKIVANPLRQPTEQEIAATRNTQAQTDQVYINTGVLTPDDVANSRFGGDAYSIETVVDWETRELMKQAMIEQGLLNPDGTPNNQPNDDPDDDAAPGDEEDAPGEADAKESEDDEEDNE